MSDRDLRALERLAAAGDPFVVARLDRALERSGALSRFEADLEAALSRAQQDGPDGPCRATLHRLDVAHALRELLEGAEGDGPRWRLAFAEPAPFSRDRPTVSSFVAAQVEVDDVVLALGRAEPEVVARDLPRAAGFDLEALLAVSDAARFVSLRVARSVVGAWCRADPTVSHERLRQAQRLVRRRPAMYFGSTDARGAHRVAEEVLALGLDEAYHGEATALSITLHADGSCTVRDDGRALDDRPGRWGEMVPEPWSRPASAFEAPSGGLRVGLASAAAVCDWLEVCSVGAGQAHVRRYERGLPVGTDVERADSRLDPGRGVAVRLHLDPSIFPPPAAPRFDRLERRARELAHLYPGLRVTVIDEGAPPGLAEHHAPDGLCAWLEGVLPKTAVGPLRAEGRRRDGEHGEIRVEAALAWVPDPRAIERRFAEEWPVVRRRAIGPYCASFANGELTREGGSHVQGLREGAAEAFARLEVDTAAPAWDAGFVGVVSIFGNELVYQGSTRDRLLAPRVEAFVASVVQSAARSWARDDPAGLEALRRGLGRSPGRSGARDRGPRRRPR
jgi:hypothetical protein